MEDCEVRRAERRVRGINFLATEVPQSQTGVESDAPTRFILLPPERTEKSDGIVSASKESDSMDH